MKDHRDVQSGNAAGSPPPVQATVRQFMTERKDSLASMALDRRTLRTGERQRILFKLYSGRSEANSGRAIDAAVSGEHETIGLAPFGYLPDPSHLLANGRSISIAAER